MNEYFDKLADADYELLFGYLRIERMIFPGYCEWIMMNSRQGVILITEVYQDGINIRKNASGASYLRRHFLHNCVTCTNREFPGQRGFGYLIVEGDEQCGKWFADFLGLDHFVYYNFDPEFQTFLVGAGRFSERRKLIFEFPDYDINP